MCKKDLDSLGSQRVIITVGENNRYHGTLWSHPAASPFVNVNSDPITFIQMLLTGNEKNDLPERILAQRK